VGKPNENDLKKAERFVQKNLTAYSMPDPYQKIQLKLPIKEGCPNTYFLTEKGTSFSLKGDIVSINQTACLGCGKCIRACPVSVIDLIENKAVPVYELYCTLCRLCINSCGQRAINLHYTWRDAIKVAKKHSHRVSL
jgi:NAD-dependent dihydropyrimidine dehydrogenase PreA subunit